MFTPIWLLITIGVISAIAWVITGIILASQHAELEALQASNAWLFRQWHDSTRYNDQFERRADGYQKAYQRSMKLNRSLIEQNHNLMTDYKAVVGALEYDEADTMLVD